MPDRNASTTPKAYPYDVNPVLRNKRVKVSISGLRRPDYSKIGSSYKDLLPARDMNETEPMDVMADYILLARWMSRRGCGQQG